MLNNTHNTLTSCPHNSQSLTKSKGGSWLVLTHTIYICSERQIANNKHNNTRTSSRQSTLNTVTSVAGSRWLLLVPRSAFLHSLRQVTRAYLDIKAARKSVYMPNSLKKRREDCIYVFLRRNGWLFSWCVWVAGLISWFCECLLLTPRFQSFPVLILPILFVHFYPTFISCIFQVL